MERPPISEVIRSLATKADKIRALHAAGYSRAEIRDALGIRYQHVRNVLIRSGIDSPIGKLAKKQVAETPAPIPAPTRKEVLLESGFELIGAWSRDSDGELAVDRTVPTKPGVYAFAVGGEIAYVGLAQRSLRMRMANYRRGHDLQRTSKRIKGLIGAALDRGESVQVLVAMPDRTMEWKGLPVNVAAGLEAGLIRKLCPAWNMLGNKSFRAQSAAAGQ
jgi:hypothetical protein